MTQATIDAARSTALHNALNPDNADSLVTEAKATEEHRRAAWEAYSGMCETYDMPTVTLEHYARIAEFERRLRHSTRKAYKHLIINEMTNKN